MSEKSLKNKVAIVTGGSGGIGNSIVKKLSYYGCKTISVYKNHFPVNQTDENTLCVKADLTKSEEWDSLLSFTLNKFGKMDVLINCAGLLIPGNFSNLQETQITKMIETNLTSLMLGTYKTLKIFTKQGFGHIINIGSLGGIVPMPYSAVYSSTKFALRGFNYSLAQELNGSGINVSLISPGAVNTKMLYKEARNNNSTISFVTKIMHPDTVANSVLKLIQKPKTEIFIPSTASITAKIISAFPALLSVLYPLLNKIGNRNRQKYLEQIFTSQGLNKELNYVN